MDNFINYNTESTSEQGTINAAQKLAQTLQSDKIILLSGPLGAGKSVFARALIRALCQNPELSVPSPTFTIIQSYEAPQGQIDHYDLYRLEDPEEIYELGWEDSLSNALTIVEWPERLGPLKPTAYLDIRIEPSENKPSKRMIRMNTIK